MLDLHTHSTASDGQLTPTELVKQAKHIKLSGIAVTDHDTTSGIPEAIQAGQEHGIRVMPGVEISTEWKEQDVHILGYFVENTGPLPSIMERARAARHERIHGIIAKLNGLGVSISYEEIVAATSSEHETLGRPHVARVLVEKKVVRNVAEAFSKLLERGKPAFVPRFKLSPGEAIRAIIASRGVPIWAHPGKLGPVLIDSLVSQGLAGVEVYHPLHTAEEERMLCDLVQRHNIVATGGSDAHDADTLGVKTVAENVWDKIHQRKR